PRESTVVAGWLAPDDEALVQVDRPVGVLREDLEDVGAAVDESAVLEAAAPGNGAVARGEVPRRQPADERPARRPARRRHARGVGELEARDDRGARLLPQLHRPRRDTDEPERVVQPEGALDRGLLPVGVGRRDDPAPAPERLALQRAEPAPADLPGAV